MKKLLAFSFIGTFFITSSPLKADWDYYGTTGSGVTLDPVMASEGLGGSEGISQMTKIYKYNSITGDKTLLNTYQHCNLEEVRLNSWKCTGFNETGQLNASADAIEWISGPSNSKKFTYNIIENNWTMSEHDNSTPVNHHDSYREKFEIPSMYQDAEGNKKLVIALIDSKSQD